jgi:hypothetical protein
MTPSAKSNGVDIYERWMEDDHPVEIARRLLVALNTEEVEEAREEHAKLGRWFGVAAHPPGAVEALQEAERLLSGALEPGAIGQPVRCFTRGEMADIEMALVALRGGR